MVDDAEILKVLNRRECAQAATETLLQMALDAGGKDNITIVLADYKIPPFVAPPVFEQRGSSSRPRDSMAVDTEEFPHNGGERS